MPRFLISLLLSFSLLIPRPTASASSKPQLLHIGSSITRLYSGNKPICTTWAIDSQMWITDAHCVVPEDDDEKMNSPAVFGIDGTPADVVAVAPEYDLAMLYTPELVAINPLQLSGKMPALDSHARAVGFPMMLSDIFDRPLSFDLRVKAEYVEAGCTAKYQMVFQGAAAPGNSGSPVIQGGKVISVVQCVVFGSIVTGATWSDLVRFVTSHVHDTIPA